MLFNYWPLFLFQDILFPTYVLHFLKLRTVIDSITFQSAPVIQRTLFLYLIKFTITTKTTGPKLYFMSLFVAVRITPTQKEQNI